MVRWTVVIGAMLKTGFGKKVHIQGFVNEPTKCYSSQVADLIGAV